MDFSKKLAMSYYKTIATLNESHNVFLVQHQDTHKIFVKKILTVYNPDIYKALSTNKVCGIPQIIDYCESDNQLTLIESYISGQSLEDIIQTADLDVPAIVNYALELCDILCSLHSMQPPVIHRDIKPSNIIITEYNHVVLLDFNAAKHFSEAQASDTVLLGTKGYAAPEQYGFGSSSPKTDIYAMGILLKELTSSLPNVPQAITEIIEKCIELNPADRYDSVADLADALKRILNTPQAESLHDLHNYKLLLPGFRTRTIWKMFIAIPSYVFILWLSLSLTIENTYGPSLWIQRIFCLLMFLTIILVTFNYMDIHKHFPLCKSSHPLIRLLGIVLLNVMLIASLFIIMIIIIPYVS